MMSLRVRKEVWLGTHRVRISAGARIKEEEKYPSLFSEKSKIKGGGRVVTFARRPKHGIVP